MRFDAPAALLFSCLGCAAGSSTPASSPRPTEPQAPSPGAPAQTSPPPVAPAARDPRRFAASDGFGALVASVEALTEAGAGDAAAGCLIARARHDFRLEADLLPAARPLPEPADDLATLLRSSYGPARVLSHWGIRGASDASLALVGFTTTSPTAARAPVAAIVLTRQGVFLRYGEREATAQDGPLPVDALGARLTAVPAHALYVTAERGVSIEALHALLATLPFDRPVALAVALAPGTRIPDEPAPNPALDPSCRGGLPRLPRRTRIGDLPADAAAAALAPLREEGARCLAAARGPALAGGKLVLALRVDALGHVEQACVLESTLADPSLARCVVESARAVAFPAPVPSGVVDLHVPLELAPLGLPAQRPVCLD